jgi:hypothetical protein
MPVGGGATAGLVPAPFGKRALHALEPDSVPEESCADAQVRRRLTEKPGNVFVHFFAPEVSLIDLSGCDADRAAKRMTVVSPAAPLPCALADD